MGIEVELGIGAERKMVDEIVGSSIPSLFGYGDRLLLKEIGRGNLNCWIIKRQEIFFLGKLLRTTAPLKKHVGTRQIMRNILDPLSTQDLSSGQNALI